MDLRNLPNKEQLISNMLRMTKGRNSIYEFNIRMQSALFWGGFDKDYFKFRPFQLRRRVFTWLCVAHRLFPDNQQFPKELRLLVVEFMVGAYFSLKN